jgi:hypothetical protein
MDLISTIEASLAQLMLELNLVLESASRSARSGTTNADVPAPPRPFRTTHKQIILLLDQAIAEMNIFQLSNGIA